MKKTNFLPLKFYVKPILSDFRCSKTAIMRILEAPNFDFVEFMQFFMAKIYQKSTLKVLTMPKMAKFESIK